jgi:hypothetical protein
MAVTAVATKTIATAEGSRWLTAGGFRFGTAVLGIVLEPATFVGLIAIGHS